MSLAILAQGGLVADPQERVSAKGAAYVTASLRVATDDGPILVSIIAFAGDVVAALIALRKGDAAAVSGTAKLTEWQDKDGTMQRGVSVVASGVLSAYQAGKRREKARESLET